MKPNRSLCVLCLLGASLLAPQLAHADSYGLRVPAQTWTIKGKDATQGLSFAIGNDDLGIGPLSLSPNAPRLAPSSAYGISRSTNTWADWQPFNNGWRTSAGLVWQQNLASDPISSSASEAIATPFLGFGWSGAPATQSNWRLSAEMGAYVSASDCGLANRCPSSGSGLRASSSSSGGMRITPYLSVGASYLY